MRGSVLNTLLQVCLQDLNWLQYLVSYCLYYELKDKTNENSAKKGIYLNAYFWHFWTLAPLLKYLILYKKSIKTTSRKSWIRWDATWWRNFNITMMSRIDVRPACGQRAAGRFYLSHRLVRVCEIEFSPTFANGR